MVPEVYCSITASSGSVGAASRTALLASAACHRSRSDSEMHTRFGSPGATLATTSARSSSRLVSAYRRTDARECASAYSSSSARRAGLSATSTMPASAAPY